MNFFYLLNILIELSISGEIFSFHSHLFSLYIYLNFLLKKIDKTSIEFLSILNTNNNTSMLI